MAETTVGYEEAWKEWRRERRETLTRPYGPLSYAALHWLGEEPEFLPDLPGRWWATDDAIYVSVESGESILLDDHEVSGENRVWNGEPTGVWSTGDRRLQPLVLSGQKAVRVLDPNAVTRRAFVEVPAFEPNIEWVKEGQFIEGEEPVVTPVGSAAPGFSHRRTVVGTLSFEHHGSRHELTVTAVRDRRTVAFKDATNALTTFGLFRSVELDSPIETGAVTVDFNRAYNPPCSFTNYGTCPLPPAGNLLPFPVEAGERLLEIPS